MIYKGYRIIVRKHPTPMDESRRGYDIDAPNGQLIKANFAELAHCKLTIDQMIKLNQIYTATLFLLLNLNKEDDI